MRMKAAQQVEESQLRYSQQVLQQQYRETTALVSEARRSLNALTPVLNTYRRKVSQQASRIKQSDHTSRQKVLVDIHIFICISTDTKRTITL